MTHASSTPGLYTLSLHDALPIPVEGTRPIGGGVDAQARLAGCACRRPRRRRLTLGPCGRGGPRPTRDRKSTRLNSSHTVISYAVFCLKKKSHSQDHVLVHHPHYN